MLFPIRCFWASRIRIHWQEVRILPFSHKCVEQTVCLWVKNMKKIIFASLKSLQKGVGSIAGSRAGSVPKTSGSGYGSGRPKTYDPDPDPQHWLGLRKGREADLGSSMPKSWLAWAGSCIRRPRVFCSSGIGHVSRILYNTQASVILKKNNY